MSRVKYIHFDFHKECSKMRWHNLNILMDKIRDDMSEFGYFYKDNQGEPWEYVANEIYCS